MTGVAAASSRWAAAAFGVRRTTLTTETGVDTACLLAHENGCRIPWLRRGLPIAAWTRACRRRGVRCDVACVRVEAATCGLAERGDAFGLARLSTGEKIQGCKCQKGRDGGVQTHHDFGGAERQSIFYTNCLAGERVSDQVGSVYLSINSCRT